ncbi:MAG: hypothetical protein ACWGQW_12900 [bacterium]
METHWTHVTPSCLLALAGEGKSVRCLVLKRAVGTRLGHSSIKLTVDTYAHWMPGKNREAMDRLPVLDPGVR